MLTRRLWAGSEDCLTDPVAEFAASLAAMGGLTERQAYRLRLATDEIATNIALHGYRNARGVIDLEGDVEANRVWLRVKDEAPAFDPRSYVPSAATVEPHLREEGGCGLLLALGNVDVFDYEYTAGRNQTTLVVIRTSSGNGVKDGGINDGKQGADRG